LATEAADQARLQLALDQELNSEPPALGLLLQTVVTRGPKVSDGTIIEAVSLPWFLILDQLKDNPQLAFQIPSDKWEEIVAGSYKAAGFEVTLTPRSGDLGRDVIAVRTGLFSIRIIDQVKAFGPEHLVTANDVRALLGVLEADKASKGYLSTTSDFAPRLPTDRLLAPYMPYRIELLNGEKLLAKLHAIAARAKNGEDSQ
jgi:restriction system protein